MPRLSNSLPKYRRHRPSGQAVVTLSGRDFYLGPYGTKASKLEYDRLIGAMARQRPPDADAERFAAENDRRNGGRADLGLLDLRQGVLPEERPRRRRRSASSSGPAATSRRPTAG